MSNLERYNRQIILPGIGLQGQQLLQHAKVLVIGAGGLGCPALQYLVAAGVGTIGIVDGDIVDLSNLHRQPLYGMDDIGNPKALTAKTKLLQQNPDCNIIAYDFYLHPTNAFELIEAYDIIVDGSDNFATRYLANDVCVHVNKPLVYGAVQRFEGQVAVFNTAVNGNKRSAQYRDIYPEQPDENTIPNCAEAGVLGVLPGIIGTMQANEVIKLITGIGKPLINKLLTYNALSNGVYELTIKATDAGRKAVPATRELIETTACHFYCEIKNANNIIPVDAGEFKSFLASPNHVIIDVREYGEQPVITSFSHTQIPLSLLQQKKIANTFTTDVVIFCQSGTRSKTAAAIIAASINNRLKVFTLTGGINPWLNDQEQVQQPVY